MKRKKKRKPNCQCFYCKRGLQRSGKLMKTRDHMRPKSRGGRATVICCFQCNNIKADMSFMEWKTFMGNNPKWWTLIKSQYVYS